jgi:hypothetical protein
MFTLEKDAPYDVKRRKSLASQKTSEQESIVPADFLNYIGIADEGPRIPQEFQNLYVSAVKQGTFRFATMPNENSYLFRCFFDPWERQAATRWHTKRRQMCKKLIESDALEGKLKLLGLRSNQLNNDYAEKDLYIGFHAPYYKDDIEYVFKKADMDKIVGTYNTPARYQ